MRLSLLAFFVCAKQSGLSSARPDSKAPPQTEPQPFIQAPWTDHFRKQNKCLRPRIPKQLKTAPEADEKLLGFLKESAVNNIVVFSAFFAKAGKKNKHANQFKSGSAGGNWMRRLACLGVKMVILAGDEEVEKTYNELGGLAYYSKEYNQAVKKSFGREWSNSNTARWYVAETITRAGYHALYVDMDVIWFEDPRPTMSQWDYDLLGQPEQITAPGWVEKNDDWNEEAAYAEVKRSALSEAKAHGESPCCQGGMGEMNIGIVLIRATDEGRRILMEARARTLQGPCENMQASMWTLFERCQPRGSAKCGLLPTSTAVSFAAFRDSVSFGNITGDDGERCGTFMDAHGKSVMRPCPLPSRMERWAVRETDNPESGRIRFIGPQILHLDLDDKTSATADVDAAWPPCLTDLRRKSAHDEM